jgi:ABC-type polysaccharide/polyol phosphate transport system ATPase subunit
MAAILEIDRVSKSFWIPSVRRDTIREHVMSFFRPRRFERFRVLDQVSFAIEPGETFGIMGRNGSGKSTLLKILCGIYPPNEGTVHRRAGITPILELGVGWNPELDAVDNIYLLASVMGLSLPEIHRDLHEILAFAELDRFANLELKHFSSGMASRLAYAVAFHVVHEVLILDEIYSVGDAGFREKCAERQRQLSEKGHTIVLVSHDAGVVSDICDRAILIDRGAIVAEGAGKDVAQRYLELATSH